MNQVLETACLELCWGCRQAKRMSDIGKKGHTLRFRDDTSEYVHDFVKDESFSHTYCLATKLRIAANG